ncbi:MAG: TAXI family TRAP transporter solute-binding subunit [Lachnospiraceae bacterium]|jgi:TRAP transporter TAXI family solute receptor|nr:TAXI family TRAP transporter solute-binding subunit [Lachnospiraceae bacterium]
MKKILAVILSVSLAAAGLAGCGSGSSATATTAAPDQAAGAGNGTGAGSSNASGGTAQASGAGEAAGGGEASAGEGLRYEDTRFISMYTSSPGGDMYNMAAAIAPFWESELNVVASIGPGGSFSNYKAISNGECTIGFDHQCMHYWGERAEGPFEETYDGVSYMMILFPATVQCFSTDKNLSVQQISDIGDKRVGFGAVGSALNVFLEDYLEAMYQITPESIVANGGSISYMSDSEMSAAMADGTIDVGFALGTYPKTSLQELENSPGLRLIRFGEDLDKYLETNPGWGKFSIPAGTYAGQEEDYETATSWAIMSVASDLDEELVYRLTRVAWENIQAEGEACAAIRNFMKLEDTLKPMGGAALHPGAERYYKEIGLLK